MKETKSKKWTKPMLSKVRKDYTSPTGYTRTYYYHPHKDSTFRRKADAASTAAGMPKIGGRKQIDIPVNKKGHIPERVMIARFLDEKKGGGRIEGTRRTRKRNILVDYAMPANTYNQKSNATYEWYRRPNKYDIKKVDTPDADHYRNLRKTAAANELGRVAIVGGNQKQREKILEHLDRNFTKKEKKHMSGLVVEIGRGRNAAPDAAGYYQRVGTSGRRSTETTRTFKQNGYIKIGQGYVDDSDVTVHETIHHLRRADADRKGALKRTKTYRGKDADLEEAMTESETVARRQGYDSRPMSRAGYWKYTKAARTEKGRDALVARHGEGVRGPHGRQISKYKAAALAENEDRARFTNQPQSAAVGDKDKVHGRLENTGAKGLYAQRRTTKHFRDSHISTLRNKGRAEAIDTFYHYQSPDGKTTMETHVYSPNGRANERELAQTIADRDGDGKGKVVAYHDGKPVTYSKMAGSYASSPRNKAVKAGPGAGWWGEPGRHAEAARKGHRRQH
tara:strand:- start:123 stop:1643 length:1521 start_codon:yes stop_codon:yes gene_type:complete